MSSVELKLDAELREDQGKGASRRLRREKRIPAIIYGGKKEPAAITLMQQQVQRLMEEEGFYSQILTIHVGKKKEQVILKDMQRHPFKPLVQHMDLQRVTAGQKLHSHVPLHFLGEEKSPGVKAGGMVHHDMIEVEIECLPKDLPEYIEVDVSGLQIDSAIHLSELELPKGVVIPALAQGADHDGPVISIRKAKVKDTGASGEEASAGEGAEEEGGED